MFALIANHSNVLAALNQAQEEEYLNKFDIMQTASYAMIEDGKERLPDALVDTCSNSVAVALSQVTVRASTNGFVDSNLVSEQCGDHSICTIPFGTTFQVNSSINLGALIVRGVVEWNDSTQVDERAFLCAGFVAIEGHGKWEMDLQNKDAFIYIKDNGATHDHLRSRAFGSVAMMDSDYPVIDINGHELKRTWSLLSEPLRHGDETVKLMHDPNLMGWRVGDRIGIAPTDKTSSGHGEAFTIIGIDKGGSLMLDKRVQYVHEAKFAPAHTPGGNNIPALMSAEVINLSRNIIITGDEFRHVPCDSSLPEAIPGEETSTQGCRCSSFRKACTLGLHTAAMHGGTARIQNTRVERCGQRGIEGKYCLHFHKLHDCPTCLFKSNAIEGSHNRGIIIHSTHSSTVEENVLYNVRGAGIYIEDGNEMYNSLNYNTVICPFPFNDNSLHGCTIPGTSNRIADTSDNQSGIFSLASTNSLLGNRVSNSFNGMLFKAGGIGRGDSHGKVCESAAKLARIEGNTFHGNGRFGTYSLGFNYPKMTDQSIQTDGHNIDKSLCKGFNGQGYQRGISFSIVDNLDYNNAFVGHYEAGDIQYFGHYSYGNLNLIYWKETKNFANGCSAHISGSAYVQGNMALPDQATFIIENTSFGNSVSLEPNHHCNVGTTGVLCFPQYIFHSVQWKNSDRSKKWIQFQNHNTQSHNANQNHGGVFSLSPPDAAIVMKGGLIENSFFPPGFVSLVNQKFQYLLDLPGAPCILSSSVSSEHAFLYDDGILCKVPLRALKVYSRGLVSSSAPSLKVEIWYNKGGVEKQIDPPDNSQIIGFHQIGRDNESQKQGYSLPVIPGSSHSYRLSLTSGNKDLPSDWIVEFSDFVIGNRFSVEYMNLSLNGRLCGKNGSVSSHHDRRFIWSGDEFMIEEAWGNTGACAESQPDDFPIIDCEQSNGGILSATECPEMCDNECSNENSYCDCGSASCKCKPGFSGSDCSFDVCAAARCGDHGSCTAKYLGGSLPVNARACVCDEGWSGPLCQYNPCQTLGKTCSGHGTCKAVGDTNAKCQCYDGYSGENCEHTCDDVCPGKFPYGCARDIDGVLRYGCLRDGGCSYLREDEEYPFIGFCTYKYVEQESSCMCGSNNDCELTVPCNSDGTCPASQYLPDSSPCNSVPFGTCKSGTCVEEGTSRSPTQPPTPQQTVKKPSTRPTLLTASPTSQLAHTYCGCNSCTKKIWDSIATDSGGSYSCGDRISWLRSDMGLSEHGACMKVSNEFPELCGPFCDPSTCNSVQPSKTPTPKPTQKPTEPPSAFPTKKPTQNPTERPSSLPTKKPISKPTLKPTERPSAPPTKRPTQNPTERPSAQSTKKPMSTPTLKPAPSVPPTMFCRCDSCTKQVWDAIATDAGGSYSCGERITWLRNTIGYQEQDACVKVSNEFPSTCKCNCNAAKTPQPTTPPTKLPTLRPTNKPTEKPSDVTIFCGCDSCTKQVWDAIATDASGSYTCGARIIWLQTANDYSESSACAQVSLEFSNGPCGPFCDPSKCG